MATIVEKGQLINWGVTETAFAGVLLVDSVNVDNSLKTHVVTNELGQAVGWIGYDQSASFSVDSRPLKGQQINYTLASVITLSSFEAASRFNENIAGGASAQTAIVENASYSQSAESAQTLSLSGTAYNFTSSPEE